MSARRLRALKHERLCASRVISASSTPYHLEIELDGLPRMTNAQRGHWAVRRKHANMWKERVMAVVKGHTPPQPLSKAKLTLTRCSTKEPDFDGKVSGFKHLIDALTLAGVIVDDNEGVIGQPTYLWEKAAYGAGRVRMKVEEIA